MDYDDNDFQGQNLQLAGEGNSKFSPVLCPYALPKFDFDDSLQGHLRFDSLVENEVFLGIPSQEDNQWIEEFSRGSSGIEFSSSAAESCSISRHNNVWSEAASSESVEMLLKSVGQGEMVPGETIVEESDAGDELRSLTEQLVPNSKQDDRIKDVINSQPALPPDQFLENLSGLNESAGGEWPHIKCTSQAQEAEISTSAYESSSQLDPNAVSEKCSLFVTKENLVVDRKCDDSNQREVTTSVIESLKNKMQEDPSDSGIQIGNINSYSQNVVASAGELNDREIQHLVSDMCVVNANSMPEDICKKVEEHNFQSRESYRDDQILTTTVVETTYNMDSPRHVSPNVDSIKEHAVETSIIKFEEPSSLPVKGDCDMQITEGQNKELYSKDPSQGSNCDVMVFSKDAEINHQVKGNVHEESPVVFQGDGCFDGHATVVGSHEAGSSAGQELKMGSPMQITHGQSISIEEKECFIASDSQMDRGASVSGSEESMLAGVDNKPFKGDESSIKNVGELASLMVACSSTELLSKKPAIDGVEGGNDAPQFEKEDSNNEEHVSPPILTGSMQMCKENLLSEHVDVGNFDHIVSSHEEGNEKLPIDSSDVEFKKVGSLDSGKGVGSSSCGEGIEESVVNAHGSEFDTNIGNKPALDTNSTSRDTFDDPSLCGDGATADEVIDSTEEQKSPVLGLGFTHLDKKEAMEVEVPMDASLANPKESSQVVIELDPITEGEEGASRDCAVQTLDEMVVQSLPILETCSALNQSDQASGASEVGPECSEKLQVHPVLCDLTVKEGDGAEAVTLENHKETAAQRSHEVESLDVAVDTSKDHRASSDLVRTSECDANRMLEGGINSADSDKPNCDSPTVISCIELSQSDDKQEEVKGAMVENVPLSEATDAVDGKVQSSSLHLTRNDAFKEERSFTFEVSPLVGRSEGGGETGKGWQSFPTIQACKISTTVEGSSNSGGCQMEPKIAQDISRGSPQASGGGITRGGAKGTSERKVRRGSGKAAGKESAKKGNPVKETTPVKQSERRDKSFVSANPQGTGQLVKFEELKSYANVERGGAKSCGVISIPTSNLPDLNTSVPPSPLFQQPFTDVQQVQLRSQIFVYGSLIQGAAPDEACMVSAFGASDGGRGAWEPTWRACVERLHGQKSHANNSESPMPSRSGIRAPDQAIKHGSLQSKVLSSPVGRSSSKGTPSPVVNTMIPLSSPVWSVSTPCDGMQSSGMPRGPPFDYHQTLSPLHPYQTPPMRNFVGHNPSWPSQAPFSGPWVASPQTSAYDVSARFPGFPITEAVKLTPVKESSVPISSAIKHVSPIPVAHSGGASVFAETSSLLDGKKVTVLLDQHSADPKARKRKKVPVTEDPGQISLLAQTRTESVPAHVVSNHLSNKVPVSEDVGPISLLAQRRTESVSVPVASIHFSTSVAVTTPACFASKSNSGKSLSAASPASSSDHLKRGDQNAEKVILSEETLSEVEEAKLKAEAAATHAAVAVNHCQGVWSQLDKQKNSGLVSDVEAKLASAAVAIAAAASVAKAAAAAAKIASNAAVQAKLMADEALVLSGTGNPTQSTTISLPNVVNNLGKATPASILKGGDGSNCSSSIIVAAKEAARRRVESASAASKHAENLDAIVKAAELAAEAVSQAGKIVAMGDPMPLKELVESGPEGYWKSPQVPSEQGKSTNVNRDQSNPNSTEEVANVSAKQPKERQSDMMMDTTNCGMPSLPREISRYLIEDHTRVVDGISGPVTSYEKVSRGQKSRIASELAKTIGVVPESETGFRSTSVIAQDEYENAAGSSKENSFNEGCLVEVFKDDGDGKAAWFSANVLSLKDGKAFVCYTELQSDEGSGQLKEWVPLEGDGNKAPGVRIAHPMTTVNFEGTRKRRRAAMTDYAWSAGDRVDAWIQDCWREGVVTEKKMKDETTFTVHFPAQRETSVVRAWHLRPTLVWKDGEWIEWSSSRGDLPFQGDTPPEKRLKPGNPAIEEKEKDKMSKSINIVESGKHEESRLLPLSANEKFFNVGKNTRDENKLDVHRATRTGLQKEGSRVIFGVPKPGKKRKFMDVSKHYVSDKSSKNTSVNDSVKFARYLMPQVSRGWKNSSKVDPKEKQAAESKPKVLKSGKSTIVPGRTLPQKDNLLSSAKSAPNDANITDHVVEDSVTINENEPGQQKLMEFRSSSNTEEAAEGPILFSSLALPKDAPKKVPSLKSKSERLNRGKLALAGGKSSKVEVKDKPILEVAEPRRSNRRIQPTSRLLEGLQSSLIISKVPATSYDKSHRSHSHNRGTFKGNNHHG